MIYTISGELYSSKNSRRLVWSKAKRRWYLLKSDAVSADEEDLCNKLRNIKYAFIEEAKQYIKPLKIEFKIYRRTHGRFDYINIIQELCDCMVKTDLLPDDNANELLPVFAPYEVDKDKPRVEFRILNGSIFKDNISKTGVGGSVLNVNTPTFKDKTDE